MRELGQLISKRITKRYNFKNQHIMIHDFNVIISFSPIEVENKFISMQRYLDLEEFRLAENFAKLQVKFSRLCKRINKIIFGFKHFYYLCLAIMPL